MFRKKKSKSSQEFNSPVKSAMSAYNFFDIKSFEKQDYISQGTMSKFYEISEEKTNVKYTAHVLIERINDFSKQKLIEHSTNLNMIMKLNHPTILKYIGFSPVDFNKQPKPIFIFEKVRYSLSSFYLLSSKERRELGWTNTRKYIFIYNLASAMSYLHSHDILHCNLNPGNIFLDDELQPKIAGFEFSRKSSDFSSRFSRFENALYLAPEVLNNRKYSKSSDVYSFAMIVYFMMTKREPFIDDVFQYIHGERPAIKKKTPEVYTNLIERCWSQDSEKRPTFDQIVKELKTDSSYIMKDMKLEMIQEHFKQYDNTETSFNPNEEFHQFDSLIELNSAPQKDLEINDLYALEDKVLIYDSLDYKQFSEYRSIVDHPLGAVCEIRNKKTDFKYLGRRMLSFVSLYKHEIINFTREINILCKLNHPSIKKFIGYSQADSVVVTEFMTNITLDSFTSKNLGIWDDTQKLITIYGIAAGMSYLHSHNVLHRDLKPKNIEFNDFFLPKITGFDISIEIDDLDGTELKGTPAYLAPEVFKDKKYSKASDVYSFSLVVYQIMTNEVPFNNLFNAFQVFEMICQKNDRPCIPPSVPVAYTRLIDKCWSANPEERPTFDQILTEIKTNSSFITEKVNSEDFYRYVKFIDSSKTSFDSTKYIRVTDDSMDTFTETPLYASVFDIHTTETNHIFLEYFDISHFKKAKQIGNGSFSSVYEIQNEEGIKYAAKMFKDLDISNFKNLKREVSALAQLHHPSIIKFIGYSPVDFSNLPCPIIVTELCCNRSLYDILNLIREEKAPSDWDDTKKLINLYGIASALAYLHSLNMVYRDVKPNNILLDDYLFPKLIDFGLSKFLNEKERKQKQNEGQDLIENSDQCGTLFYMAPELISPGIDNPHFIKASDVYSFAITAYEIMTNLRPFQFTQAYKHMTYIGSGKRPKFTTPILDCYRNLIERCWSQDPNKRPLFDEIVTELKTNRDFITDSVNEEDFINYVQFIDESRKSFCHYEPSQRLNDEYEEILQKKFPSFCKVNIFESLNEKKIIKKLKINISPIKLDHFEKQKKIGEGCFGNVYKVIDKATQNIYAAKISKKNLDICKDITVKDLEREINIISILNHPSIMKFIGFSSNNFKNKPKPVIVTELISNGSLKDIIELERNSCCHPDWDDTKKLINIFGIASGMKYLHSKNILHRDLKPDNILLDDYLYPKIADFGLSKDLEMAKEIDNSGFKGTPAYCSPEVFKEEYSKGGDVYAFAMITYEIMTCEVIFKGMSHFQLIDHLMNGFRPTPKYEIPTVYHELIKDCWQDDPAKRPSFEEIVNRLKNDKEFITENVDEDEFLNYIDLIEESADLLIESKPETNKKKPKSKKHHHHHKKAHKTSVNISIVNKKKMRIMIEMYFWI